MHVGVLETRNYIVGEANAASGLYLQQGEGWRHTGWTNLRCTAIAQTSDALFLGAGNGVLRSRDGGASWRVTTDWRLTEVLDLVASPTTPHELVAATAYGLWRTEDAGETWEGIPSPSRLPDATFTSAVVLDASQPTRMLIATAAGMFESTNAGQTWNQIGPQVEVRALAQSTANPMLWLAGTAGHGALLSKDGGRTWASTGDASSTVYAVALCPVDPQCMAVGGYQTGVHMTTSGGASWRSIGDPSFSIHALAFDPRQPGRLWIGTVGEGLYVDDGAGWEAVGLPETTITAFASP